MFSFIKTLIATLLFLILYYFFYYKPTTYLTEYLTNNSLQTDPNLLRCQQFTSKDKCVANEYCTFDKDRCISNCNRKECKAIKTKEDCDFSSTTSNQLKEPACVWRDDNCRKCPWDYVMPDPITKELSCYENKCENLPKHLCESPLFNQTCCWNPKTKKCECRSKKQDPQSGQCLPTD